MTRRNPGYLFLAGVLLATLSLSATAQSGPATPSYKLVGTSSESTAGSVYIPLDSWIYPAAIRLYELGYLPTAYLGMRPWTRASLAHMLTLSESSVRSESSDEAQDIFASLSRELALELADTTYSYVVPESLYTRASGIGGSILNDSFHLGQTVINDYGRPFQPGFNNITGYSVRANAGRFSLYLRGEYQHAPSGTGYSTSVAQTLADLDLMAYIPPSIPHGPIASQNNVRLLEANVSTHLIGHEISFGKSDAWLGPAAGSSMAWSNNAENIYSFRINRVEPLYIPVLSRFVGLFRYDFFVGSLKGHVEPNDPWIHSEKISFKPTPDLEFGFQRSVIWGGKGHVPITVHTFLRSFFSTTGVEPAVKFSREDPGARFSTFDFTWRIPWRQHLVTVYTDSLVHDNVFPVSNPGRAGLRPGVYLARLPAMPHVDLRVEGASTDPQDPGSSKGQFLYFESAQKQGYTNRNFIIGDWIGRQGKGGQAWLTWHLRPEQSLQLEYRMAKAASDFIPGGTTQQQLAAHTVLRFRQDLELRGTVQAELWRAPLIAAGTQRNILGSLQITYFPSRKGSSRRH
jgi:hypothetical protein